jgi:hypothetical protein
MFEATIKAETPTLPEPKDGEDYYIDELRTHTVTISVAVGGLKERDSDEDMCSKAVEGLRDGSLDGDATIVWSEKVRDVELDFETDQIFDRRAWMKAKLLELGLNEFGEPLRPGEKTRPDCETTLADFPNPSPFMQIMAWIRRQWRAVQGAV